MITGVIYDTARHVALSFLNIIIIIMREGKGGKLYKRGGEKWGLL